MMPRPPLLLPLLLLVSGWAAEGATPSFGAKLWASPVPYALDEAYTQEERDAIHAALAIMTEKTCLEFKENLPGPLMFFERGAACSSSVGDQRRTNLNHTVQLAGWCAHTPGTHHETMHALGFEHTHCRADRDEYVKIYEDNIPKEDRVNYEKEQLTSDTTYYGIPYDFGSLLHYDTNTLSRNKTKFIMPIDMDYKNTIDSKGHGMTFSDWKNINKHYKCSEKCPTKIECQNGGYQHPRKCTECVCTRFHDGTLCENERAVINLKIGDTVKVDEGFPWDGNLYTGIIVRKKDDPRPLPDLSKVFRSPPRVYKAPEGARFRVTIDNILDRENTQHHCWIQMYTCENKALEIVDGDMTRVGKKFCCAKDLPYTFESTTNVIGHQIYAIPGLDFVANITLTVVGSNATPQPSQLCELD